MDTISDFLTKLRNALQIKKPELRDSYSKIKLAIAKILVEEGYVEKIDKIKDEDNRDYLILTLKYDKDNQSIIHSIKTLSTPGRHLYVTSKKLPRVKPLAGYQAELGMVIISTSRGIMTVAEARKKHLGGELIAEIY